MSQEAGHTEPERAYIRKHDLHIALENLVGEALKERPEDPLVFIALRLLQLKMPPAAEKLVSEVIKQQPKTDDECRKLFGDISKDAKVTSETHVPPTESEMIAGKKKIYISARHCVVCGKDDRAGQTRKSGFKCNDCVGIPRDERYVVRIDEDEDLVKGKDDEGFFALNNYRILGNIGQGAYGKVRHAFHTISNQAYAIKFLSKINIAKKFASGNPNLREEGIKKIREEIEIMKRLSHPNILQIIGTMENEEELMIITDYLAGGQIFPSNYPATPIPLGKLKRYIVGISQGLQYLHSKGVVHRDIKPDNILLDGNDNVKLADFGVSSFGSTCDDGTILVKGFAGSPYFMPPEQFDDENSDKGVEGPATDMWSFGVTLYAMSFGSLPPFTGGNILDLGQSVKTTEIPINHECHLLNDFIGKLLDRDPTTRMSVTQVMKHELLRDIRIVKGQPVETVEVGLMWEDEKVSVGPDARGDMIGADTFKKFMSDSKDQFQIIQGNSYEVCDVIYFHLRYSKSVYF